MKSVGIDIGSFSIKVFAIEMKGKELLLQDFREYALGTSPTADNSVLILDILRQVVGSFGTEGVKYVFALSQNQVSSRPRMFPFKERNKVLKTIPFELEEDIPFDLFDSVFDAKFVRFLGPAAEVIASATPKANVLKVIELAQSVGIDPDIISAQGVAFANLVEDYTAAAPTEVPQAAQEPEEDEEGKVSEDPRASGHVLIDIGHSSSVVTIYRDFRLVDVRTIDWGGTDVAEAIAKRYRLQYEEALKELQSKAFVLTSSEGASKDQIIFSDTIGGSFTPMIRDLRLFLLDAENEFHLEINHIALTGGTSQIRNLAPFLSRKTGYTFTSFDIFEHYPNNQIELSAGARSASGSSLALAIEGIKRPLNPATNFRKEDLSKKSEAFQVFWEEWGELIRRAAIAIVLFWIYAFAQSYIADDSVLASKSRLKRQAKSMGLTGSQARPRGLKKYIRQKKTEMANKANLAKMTEMNTALDILVELSRKIPKKDQLTLDLTLFELENSKLALEGTVSGSRELAALERSLRSMAKGGKVVAGNAPPPPGAKAIRFKYTLNVDRKFPKRTKSRGQKS